MKKVDLRKQARGRDCQMRIPGICNFNPAGTCGTGCKPDDAQGAWGCDACHSAVDGRIKTPYSRDELRLFHAEAVFRTQSILRSEGKL